MTTNKTITALQSLDIVQSHPESLPVVKYRPKPPPFVKVTVEVQTDFQLVTVEIFEDCLATCDHDKQSNAIRQSEMAVCSAFKEIFKQNNLREANAHKPASTN